MNKKYPWLPVDERLIPDIFSFKYPKSFWVRAALALEMFCAVVAVAGTLVLVLMPQAASKPYETQAIDSSPFPTSSPFVKD